MAEDFAHRAAPLYDFTRTGHVGELPIIVGPYHFVDPSFEVHRHTYGELVLVLSGSGVHVTEQGEYILAAGDVFYVPPDVSHGFSRAVGMEIQNVAFDPQLVEGTCRPSLRRLSGYHALFHLEPMFLTRDGARNRLQLRSQDVAALRPLLEQMIREYRRALPGHGALLLGYTLELVARLCRLFSEVATSTDSSVGRLARVSSLIETKFASPLSLHDLANAANISRNHLIRLFTETYGVTPMRRLMHVRLEHAQRLLASTESPVAEIAEACGFPDANYFARLFKRHVGRTPSDFRQP